MTDECSLLSPAQCGFHKGQGTLDVLIRLEKKVKEALNTRKVCLVVYLELKAAFDTVWSQGLISKLIRLGVGGNLIKWIHNYFENRKYWFNQMGQSQMRFF